MLRKLFKRMVARSNGPSGPANGVDQTLDGPCQLRAGARGATRRLTLFKRFVTGRARRSSKGKSSRRRCVVEARHLDLANSIVIQRMFSTVHLTAKEVGRV